MMLGTTNNKLKKCKMSVFQQYYHQYSCLKSHYVCSYYLFMLYVLPGQRKG